MSASNSSQRLFASCPPRIPVLLLAVTALAMPVARSARAATILPGFDLFATTQPTTAVIPNVGTVTFCGRPFAPGNMLGDADTIVQRTGTFPPGGTGMIPIELVSLSLVSCNPVTIPPFGAGDLYVTINRGMMITGLPQPDALPPSTGTLTVQTHIDAVVGGGGTFDSFFDVFPDAIFVAPGADVTNPANWLFHAPIQEGRLFASGTPWSHTPPPGYPMNPNFPSGNFYPVIMFTEEGPTAVHTIRPAVVGNQAIPEPSGMVFLCSGLFAFCLARRCKALLNRCSV